ncbi:cytochrome c oxidase accessory protein CcoG [Noviherbaspirillum autotrophicum]|uniref:Cytochrome C oxidase n=1 Tax=Noviherbaspirillum autotrophicum TaxID=709839 RepID=A0A0C1Y4Q1_9BURK|nr:cytochrome c oxidase accessory protein CcoG [Noviherbaspirillum autotrophicum]KIF81642.1 cytochrome C oxidase [Noviherbaspirillum autotrophicum]KIF82003.1 cytochrome C oxidase [Noviherbaspirillum autotrophicum]KIF84111.1 cytochrome C oxidase [Noviherbaspirillum autotrophicum]
MSQSAQTVSVVKMYAPREQIYARAANGVYANWRWACVWLTQLIFYGLPWLSWNGRQAVLFDLAARKFYLFGIVLWPQDLIYLALLLIIAAFSLFLFTAVAGRVWCGFSCPQTVYTEIFMWFERKIEGERSARMRLDRQPWSIAKFSRKASKHAAWGLFALWTGFTLVAYFTPARTLALEAATLALGPWQSFWILFYGFATYGNAGWLREQVCRYMCPYARFQSSMFDPDTLIVSYDQKRGEPRNALAKATAKNLASGSCIDCSLCVQVCPTGIDIRNGLQSDCIGCAACVDACNSVMDKIGAARGLIRFTTENALRNNLAPKQIARRVLRPRVLIYTGILVLVMSAFWVSLLTRTPLKMDVIRDRGAMGREVEEGMIENAFRLQIMSTDEHPHRYKISVTGIEGISLVTQDEVQLQGAESRAVPVTVHIPKDKGKAGSNTVTFGLQAQDDVQLQVKEKAVFFVPR